MVADPAPGVILKAKEEAHWCIPSLDGRGRGRVKPGQPGIIR